MKLSREIIFWVITTMLLSLVFGSQFNDFAGATYFVIILLPVMLGTSYMFSDYLVPKLLLQKKYLRFAQYTAYVIIISLNLEMIVITVAYIVIANYRYQDLMVSSSNLLGLTITMYFVVLLKSFSNLITSYFSDKAKLTQLEDEAARNSTNYLNIKSNRKNVRINHSDILYIESLSDYARFHMEGQQTVISKEKISHIATLLPTGFLRAHRSFIVNISKIQTFTSESITLNGQEIPIGRKYKKDVQQALLATSST